MKQKFIAWFTRGNNGYAPAINADGDFEREKTQHLWEAYQGGAAELAEQVRQLTEQRDAVVAENAGLIRSAECLLHEASEVYRAYNKTQLPDGDLVDGQSLQEVWDAINATPATDSAIAALQAEAAQMRQIIDSVTNLDNEPQYHEQGMGCGLEDRNITDRYDAMHYGWEEAMERVYAEVIPCAEELSFPATDAILDSLRAEGVDRLEYPKNTISSNGWTISPEFLYLVSGLAQEKFGYSSQMEETEATLLAGLELLRESKGAQS